MKSMLLRAALYVAPPLAVYGVMHSQQTQTQRFPQLENDDVRVWRSVVLPNAPLPPHRHDHPRIIIPLQGGNMDIVEKGSSTDHNVWEAGHAYWLPANPPNTQHVDVNVGTKPIEVMVVELKKEQ